MPDPRSGHRPCPRYAVLLVLLLCAPAAGEGFRLESAEVQRGPEDFRVDLGIDYHLSREMLEAVRHGIPLQFRVELELRRVGWIYDPVVARSNNRRLLKYHELSGLYQVTDLGNNARRHFALLREALRALGRLQRLRLATPRHPLPPTRHRLRVRAGLAVEALPSPLQPRAHLHPAWHLDLPWQDLELP